MVIDIYMFNFYLQLLFIDTKIKFWVGFTNLLIIYIPFYIMYFNIHI